MRRSTISLAILMAFAVLLAACSGVKQAKKDLLYLKNGNIDTLPNLSVPIKESKIQKDDILSIVVYSDNPDATALYNQGGIGSGARTTTDATTASKTTGYLVDQTGKINFYGVGRIEVAGMTRLQLMDTLTQRLMPFLSNPYVDVRFLNARVTVLGEVQRPGVFNMPAEKISVLELIGMAGDITIYGRKDDVLIIREQNGKREFGHLDLRKTDIFQSPYFYLQQNDMVVISPSSKKPTATEQENLRRLTMVTSLATLASTLAILISIFK